MTVLDLVLICIIIYFALSGFFKGFVKVVAGLVSNIVVLLLTYYFAPVLSAILQKTAFYDILKSWIAQSMNIEEKLINNLVPDQVLGVDLQTATEIIQSTQLPDFLKDALISNNNPEIHKLLDVSAFTDYIYGYMANIAMNAISAVLIFLLLSVVIKVIFTFLNLFAKLPVLNTLNRVSGLVFGIFEGIIFAWVAVVVVTLLATFPIGDTNTYFAVMLSESIISKFFTNTNFLLDMVLKMSHNNSKLF